MTHQEFISTMAPIIAKYCKEFNYPFVSPILAQAILESAWGTSYKAITGFNFFGLKYTTANRVPSAEGYFFDGGSEQNKDGSYTLLQQTTKWCKFSSFDKGVRGYFEFLTNGYGLYNNLPLAVSPFDYLQKIKAAGYATSLNYVANLTKVIQDNNLTQYDKKENIMVKNNSINIIQCTNTHNLTLCPSRKKEWIVLHYTAGVRSIAGSAKAVANWFKNPQCKASADFIVDDAAIVQYNPDLDKYYTWAVGGSKYSNLSTSLGAQYYGVAKNSNTINIEMCSNKRNSNSLQATDKDWYFTDETINQAVKLVKYLMSVYNIGINHVIMHHMITGKICPNPWSVDEHALDQWYAFKNKIQGQNNISNISKTNTTTTSFQIKILRNDVNIRTSPNGNKTGSFTGTGIFTIIEEQNGWGLLKSYASGRNGWVYLNDTSYIQRL